MYAEELFTTEGKGTVPKRQVMLQQMLVRQQKMLITDIFLLVSLVLRDRVGKIQANGDRLWDTLMRKKDLQIFGFSAFGMLCTVVMASVLWYNGRGGIDPETNIYVYVDVYTSQTKENTARYAALVMLQLALTTSTLTCCILLIQRAHMFVKGKRHMWSGIDMEQLVKVHMSDANSTEYKEQVDERFRSSYSLWQSDYRWRLVAEVLVHLIHPVVWLNEPDTQILFRVLECAIFVRLYFFANVLHLNSKAYQQRNEVLASNGELKQTGSPISPSLTFKMLFYAYPIGFTGFVAFFYLLTMGFVMFIAERTEQPSVTTFGSLENAYWFSFVTFTTVGYGDLVPTSHFGRFVSVLIGAAGIVVITVFTGIVTNLASQSREQRFVQEYLTIANAAKRCQVSAALVIQSAYRFFKLRAGNLLMPWVKRRGHKANFLYARILEFKKSRWRLTRSMSTASDPVIDSKLNFVRNDLIAMSRRLEQHEKSVTATIDNLHQRVEDIVSMLGEARNGTFDRSPSFARPETSSRRSRSEESESIADPRYL